MTHRWLRALLLLPFLGLSACGGGGGGGSTATTDTAPSVSFAFSCSDLTCSFTSTSTDQDAGDSLSYVWNFGDGSAQVTTANASHTYAAAGTYNVSLAATDRFGVPGVPNPKVSQVTVTAPPAPAAPHANFSVSCVALTCTFTDTSTFDAGSVFQSRVWDFGDSVTLAATTPAVHLYSAAALTTFTVKLTVTDATGKVSTSIQSIPVAPPATTLNCVGGGCALVLAQASKVTATLVSHSCTAHNNQVVVTAPITQMVVTDGCFDPVGTAVPLNGGATFAANTVLQVEVLSGLSGTTALVFPPSIRVSGDFASGWTLTFDDGFGGPGEPDFNDLVILIKATP
jgi:PKD repeat protein